MHRVVKYAVSFAAGLVAGVAAILAIGAATGPVTPVRVYSETAADYAGPKKYRELGFDSREEAKSFMQGITGQIVLWDPEHELLATLQRQGHTQQLEFSFSADGGRVSLTYTFGGEPSRPRVRYSVGTMKDPEAPDIRSWEDLNADGLFDVRVLTQIDPKNTGEIFADGQWMPAREVEEGDGAIVWATGPTNWRFDWDSGRWQRTGAEPQGQGPDQVTDQ